MEPPSVKASQRRLPLKQDLWSRYKERISLVSSVGAIALSVFTYFSTVWRSHEVRAFVSADLARADDDPVQLVLSNVGEHAEVVFSAAIRAAKCDAGSTHQAISNSASPPVIIPKATSVVVNLEVSSKSLIADANKLLKSNPEYWALFDVQPMLIIDYLSATGESKPFCAPVGRFDAVGNPGAETVIGIDVSGSWKSIKVFRESSFPFDLSSMTFPSWSGYTGGR